MRHAWTACRHSWTTWSRSGERHHPGRFADFRRILAEIDKHPNRRYFILKSIIVNNLYGVDIMEEAGKFRKLRHLFS